MCLIFSSILISTEALEQASMFVELKVVPKSFHYQMSQFVTKAATINFKKKNLSLIHSSSGGGKFCVFCPFPQRFGQAKFDDQI